MPYMVPAYRGRIARPIFRYKIYSCEIKKNSFFFYLIVVVLVQVISIHLIKHLANIRNRQEIIFGRQYYIYIYISFGEENLLLFRLFFLFVSVNCSCFFCTLFLYHCCGKLKEMIKIAKKNFFFFLIICLFIQD